MQVSGQDHLLEKYNLKANDAILAEGKQKQMYVAIDTEVCVMNG